MVDSQPTFSPRLVLANSSNLDIVMPLIQRFYEHFGYPFEASAKRRALAGFFEDAALGRLWLIEQAGATSGYALVAYSFGLEFNGRVAFIDELWIEPSARGTGIGSWVLSELEAQCAKEQVACLRLEADFTNERAEALYLRRGYVDHRRRLLTKRVASDHIQQ